MGIAVRFFSLMACGKVAPKSGLVALRYRMYQLVSTLRCIRLVRRFAPEEPVAVLPGRVVNFVKSTGSAPFDSRYLFRKLAWLTSSRVLLVIYCGPSPSSCDRAVW